MYWCAHNGLPVKRIKGTVCMFYSKPEHQIICPYSYVREDMREEAAKECKSYKPYKEEINT